MNTQQLLREARRAINRGDNDAAKKLLVQLLKSDPLNEKGWLWMTAVVDDPQLKMNCLKRILEVNPLNEAAQRGMAKLRAEERASQRAPQPAPWQTPSRDTFEQPTHATCGLCKETTESFKGYTVYTARIAGVRPGFRRITYYYDSFWEHTYQVCASCKNWRNIALPLFVWTVLLLVVVAILIWSSEALCFLIFWLLLMGIVVTRILTVGRALAHKAVKARRSGSRERYRGFVESDLKRLRRTR